MFVWLALTSLSPGLTFVFSGDEDETSLCSSRTKMAPLLRTLTMLLVMASASAQVAHTPDGRLLRPDKYTLQTFNGYDMNGDGYIKRQVTCFICTLQMHRALTPSRYVQELVKRWMDLNIVGWKNFDAFEYEDAANAAQEEVDSMMEGHDQNGDGKLDLAEYMAANVKNEL